MRALRRLAVRHAGPLDRAYRVARWLALRAAPLADRLGRDRIEAPFAAAERMTKGLLFDCRMCGQCVLSSTGMSCPMNCPKQLRNGPCGGVRQDGSCEVVPDMPCVWVAAWEGSRRMADPDAILAVQPPVDHRCQGRSAWLRLIAAERAPAR